MAAIRARSIQRPAQSAPPTPSRRRPPARQTPAGPVDRWIRQGTPQALRELQRLAGNQATTLVLQRSPKAPDPSKGERWNDGKAYEIGRVFRVSVTGLKGGTSAKWQEDDSHHTTEPADHRAVVLVPDGFKPDQPTEVLLYFHGHNEAWRGRFAGWRQRTFKATKQTADEGLVSDDTVRDVALDQIEQQIESSGHTQMIGILPQGGPQHQFGNIAGDDYIRDVLEKANKAQPTVLKAVPDSWKVVLSGHSGGGWEVANQLSGAPRFKALEAIILFDAEGMKGEIARRIQEDMTGLSDLAKTDVERTSLLDQRPAVRVFARDKHKYGDMYGTVVEDTIADWTANHRLSTGQKTLLARLRERDACTAAPGKPACRPLVVDDRRRMEQLGKRQEQMDAVTRFLPKLRGVYQVTLIDPSTVEHEEIIRGTKTSNAQYVKGEGNLEKGLRSL